jgi:amino acid adenylation domain-containing protein
MRELTPAERRFWFLGTLDPDTTGYHVTRTFMLEGAVDANALAAALRMVIERHPILRTRVEIHDGVPYAALVDPKLLELVHGDTDLAPMDHFADEADRPFDLQTGPLFRAVLLDLGSGRAALQYVVHHMIFDGLSRVVFERDLSAAYRAVRANELCRLPRRPERDAAGSNPVVSADELEYWTRRLSNPPALRWPIPDRSRSSDALRAEQLDRTIDSETIAGLRSLATEERTSLFTVGLSLYAHLIGRMAHSRDIIVGCSLAGRSDPDLEDAIGLFMNTTAYRIDIDPNATPRRLVRHTRDIVLDGIDHSEVPFDAIVAELDIRRSDKTSPLFSNWFAVESGVLLDHLDLDDIHCVVVDTPLRRVRFDTELTVRLCGSEATAMLAYPADGAASDQMKCFLGHYVSLLGQAAENPDRSLSIFDHLEQHERRELIQLGSPSREGGRLDLTSAILRHAQEHPDELALEDEEEQLSYGELVLRATDLARRLAHSGVRPGDVVAVHLERSPAFIVAAFGVLLASAAYLPIPDDVPPRRRDDLLEDSSARAIIVHADDGLHALSCPAVAFSGASEGDPHSLPDVASDRLIYVVYTSGSTGRPKGVAVSHDQLARLVAWHNSRYQLTRRDRVAQLASTAFDAFGWEVWSALAAGATLVVCREETVADPSALRAWLSVRSITIAFAPTPVAETLIRHDLARTTSLRVLLTGGDRFRPRPKDEPGIPIIDHYGPTENAVVATATEQLAPPWHNGSIGRPIDGVAAYVVDETLQLTPRGAVGELCLGGSGVAWGYRNRPVLTASSFVPDPFSSVPGARMYRTGDLASWRPDDQLAFLGRADDQLEIGGRRVEPAEVEHALLGHDAIRDVVVVARPDQTGRDALVAYVVSDSTIVTDELRRWLSERLPRFLVPSLFVQLDRLPVGPTGKVARKQLPEPEWQRKEPIPPRTPVETRIARHWRSLFPDEHEVSVEDDFFELGGNSVVAAQLIARLSDEFGVRLALRSIFDSGTIAGVAQEVEAALRAEIDAMSPDEIAEALEEIRAQVGGELRP